MEKRFTHYKLIFICIFSTGLVFSQTGGQHIYQFMNTSPGARISALGGMPISWRANDPAAVYLNPSLLNTEMSGALHFSSLSYFSDISFGHFSYTHGLDSADIALQLGIHYANYGDITRTDPFGNSNGSFKASDSDIYLAASKTIKERIQLGASLHYISSSLDLYSSQGLSLNAGVSYFNPEKKFGLSLLFKHLGFQLSKYHQTSEKLPFEVQLAYSKKLKHLPLIYHIGIQHLQKWNVRYDDPDLQDDGVLFGDTNEDSDFSKSFSNALRHFVFGVELNIGKKENFSLRFGYNNLRNRELSLADYRSLSGLSGGFGIKIYKFKFDYSYASYHIAGGSSQISISTNLNHFFGKEI
ncbi:MAG: type IX secretion system protein PorQ [Saprospiraceae bacterium]|nr:type IX secretion system protein PorQ [Saprospiraceae bacterium]